MSIASDFHEEVARRQVEKAAKDAYNQALEDAAKAIEEDTIPWGDQGMRRFNATYFANKLRAMKR